MEEEPRNPKSKQARSVWSSGLLSLPPAYLREGDSNELTQESNRPARLGGSGLACRGGRRKRYFRVRALGLMTEDRYWEAA